MEALPSEPSVMAVDLSKSFSAPSRTRNQRTPASDLPTKPEWYHRCPTGSCLDSSYGTGSYEREDGVAPSHVSAGLPQGVYRDGDLWCPGFYQAGASCEDDSDSGSDVIVLLAASKEPLLCASFVADGVRRIVEPLSPAPSLPGCCQQTLSLQSSDTSSSEEEEEEEMEEESESSADIPPHHARPVVLLADLSTDYAVYDGATRSCADVLSDDSDVVEVPSTRKRPTFPPNKIQDKSAAVGRKRSVRISANSVQTPLSPWSTRHRLARSAKKDAVGVYYESCNSDDATGYALESDDDVHGCHAGRESDSSCQSWGLNQSHEAHQHLTADKAEDARETDHVNESGGFHPRRVTNKANTSRQGHTSESDDALQRHVPDNPDNTRQRHAANKSNNSQRRRATNKSADTGKRTSKSSAVAKKSVKRQRRKRKAWCPPSSLFSPPEPQIKLRCTAMQEVAKKKKTSDNFCPFVRVRTHGSLRPNDVTVVNQQDQLDVSLQKQQNAARSSGVIPKTSCFRLGRLKDAGDATPLCCLCGRQANADGLGDLHGPYFPASGRPAELLERGDAAAHQLDERWVHSDCSVWSGQVFLVRGNLYGLREAEQLASHTICSGCHLSGAIMGCSHKGCTRSFHYACALPSGCVLNEDNLSLRCSQHHMTTCQQQHDGHARRKSWRAARRHIR
ncbi:uncharacterized protein LOC119125996 [Syngnathus acus]|uniref:uncharacterized protein LOC119125996 n=1 Tax=Syngnathus acus TaxID=161584 RepID=UPI0018864C73|nr:uncharacterized protein LOC119125996 [Syngnathus acus]XP_037112875.1 uncharacterized protein LOC119125996 [Syngnathus acus]